MPQLKGLEAIRGPSTTCPAMVKYHWPRSAGRVCRLSRRLHAYLRGLSFGRGARPPLGRAVDSSAARGFGVWLR